jgi:hypothetical protein
VARIPGNNWSPADNSYAIAVSEAQWWQRAAQLAVLRIRGEDDNRISWFSSRQIDARQLIFALRQVLAAERLEQLALEELGIDPAVRDELAKARERFEDLLSGIKHMRDALMHFDEWSRGEGRGPQRDRLRAGEALRDIASAYWGFAYDPAVDTVSLGPYSIDVGAADSAAKELTWAIYTAAREVDKRKIAELRARAAEALTKAGVGVEPLSGEVMVSPGDDLRIWISLRITTGVLGPSHRELATRVAAALTVGGLRLTVPSEPQSQDVAERLARGEALLVEPETQGLPHGSHGRP